MGNSLRCCLACVLPCGALDLIRIVHLNGFVEEITRQTTAAEILQAYPNHVLSKPCSQGMVRKIMILSPDSELKRGSIYFLIPDSSLPSSDPKKSNNNKIKVVQPQPTTHDNDHHHHHIIKISKSIIDDDQSNSNHSTSSSSSSNDNDDDDDDDDDGNNKVLSLDLSALENVVVNSETKTTTTTTKVVKAKSGKHQRRRSSRGKSGIWQPHLEIITEDL